MNELKKNFYVLVNHYIEQKEKDKSYVIESLGASSYKFSALMFNEIAVKHIDPQVNWDTYNGPCFVVICRFDNSKNHEYGKFSLLYATNSLEKAQKWISENEMKTKRGYSSKHTQFVSIHCERSNFS